MVFSFFKKAPQKMPEPTAARPRMPLPEMKLRPEEPKSQMSLDEPLPDLDFVTDKAKVPPAAKASLALSAIDEFEAEFTESSVMAIDVEHEVPPLQADVEQVVVLFANDQDAAARSVLESLLSAYSDSDGVRLWRLLFDLLQVQGDQAAFERRSVEFAQKFEMSPPAWRVYDMPAKAAAATGGAKVFVLQGVLTDEHRGTLQQLGTLLGEGGELRIDCSRLAGCDDQIAGMLADLLTAARRLGKISHLIGAEGFIKRLDERLQAGTAEHEAAWRLLLELLQRQGTQAHFEERAVDYAVTFEHSPPSWETVPATAKPADSAPPAPADEAIYLAGPLRNQRFAELQEIIERQAQPIIDFSAVPRLDFYSAGQLVNRLGPFKAAGKEIVIRSPNHLIAELMAVVGLNKQARIIVPKS